MSSTEVSAADGAAGQYVTREIVSQPQTWAQAVQVATAHREQLPQPGERVAVVGCGTSAFIAQAYAAYREGDGQGITDAFFASEYPAGRRYDLVVAITRSGTTTEVLDLLAALPDDQRSLIIVGDDSSPGVTAAGTAITLAFADEQSVVQTRFATTALALLRAGLGHDLDPAIQACRAALTADLPTGWERLSHFVYLGHGPAVGMANEAALKLREAAIAWAESYPAYDYRHGPIAVADAHTLVWIIGRAPDGLADQITTTGAQVESRPEIEPMAELVRAQRLAVALSLHKGLDPDAPRHLTRSIILDA